MLRRPLARVVLLIVFLEGSMLYGPFAFLATHLHLHTGVSLSGAGGLVTLYALGGMLFAIASRRLVAWMGEAGLARGGGALMLAGLMLAAFSPVWWTAPLACTAAGLGFYMFHNTLQTNATQMAPTRRGTAVALFASLFFLGQSLGVALAGRIAEGVGTAWMLTISALAMLPVGFGFSLMRSLRK